jgi:hypothetical protein
LKRIEAAIPDISGVKRMKLDDALSDGLVRQVRPRPGLHRPAAQAW